MGVTTLSTGAENARIERRPRRMCGSNRVAAVGLRSAEGRLIRARQHRGTTACPTRGFVTSHRMGSSSRCSGRPATCVRARRLPLRPR